MKTRIFHIIVLTALLLGVAYVPASAVPPPPW